MATLTHADEKLAETEEVFYLTSNMIDNEPYYKNFTTIQNVLRHRDEQKQLNTSLPSTNEKYQTESFHFNKQTHVNHRNSSKIIDGSIINLIQIVEDIGCDPKSPFVDSPRTIIKTTFSNIRSQLDRVHGPLVDKQSSHVDEQYFQKSYLNKNQQSALTTQHYPIDHMNRKTTQLSNDNESDVTTEPTLLIDVAHHQIDQEHFQNNIYRMYGFDEGDTISSASSRGSSMDDTASFSSDRSSTPLVSETIDNSKPKQQITIREYYPTNELSSLVVNGSLSPSSQQTTDDNFYEQFIKTHPDFCQDPNPEIITKRNPDQITYKQNISVCYLVPPTPPPPGPLIIREIVPPRLPTPPPVIIKHQEPAPPTPPPLIIREAPPTPPPPSNQEPKIITKVLPQKPPPRPQEIREHKLPSKPQSIIIEKWLPYKPPPPREVIYERVIEAPMMSEFQPGRIPNNQERRHSADRHLKSSPRVPPAPIHIEQSNSVNCLENKQPSTFEKFAWATQQQLEALQHRVIKKIQDHKEWVVNEQQQHLNMYRQAPTQLTTPALIINHPPTIRTTTTAYAPRPNVQQQAFCQPAFIYPSYT